MGAKSSKGRKCGFSLKFSLLLALSAGGAHSIHLMVLSLEELTRAFDRCSVFSFSIILWMGDLNYRVEELDVEKVKQLVEEKAFQELCQYDQVPLPYLLARGRLETACRFSSSGNWH